MNTLVWSRRDIGTQDISPQTKWLTQIADLESENQLLQLEVTQLQASLEGLAAENKQMRRERDQAVEEQERLRQRVQEVERQVGLNSHNSSRPPSSDGLRKTPVCKNLREKTERRPGGQLGHPGHTLKMSTAPDTIVVHSVQQCANCLVPLQEQEVGSIIRRQEWDLPPLRLLVTEHQGEVKRCKSCGHKNVGQFPAHIQAPVQYGAGVKAFVVYLREAQHLPYERTQQLFVELFKQSISEATIQTAQGHCQRAIAPVLIEIEQQLCQAGVTHHDETGLRVEGKLRWCHVACTPNLTRYILHTKRGKEGMDAMGVLPQHAGQVAVHDYFSSYSKYPDVLHAFCNAHVLRELIGFAEDKHNPQRFAKEMILLLQVLKARVEQAQHPTKPMSLNADDIDGFMKRYDEIVEKGWQDNPLPEPSGKRKRGRPKKTDEQNLLARLKEHKPEQLRFLTDWRVPFDNNQAERDLRMVKLQQKISGSFRTVAGASQFLDIRSYLSTARKRGYSMLEAIRLAVQGKPLQGG